MKQAKLAPLEGAGASRIWANLLTANNRLCGRHDWGLKIAGECKCRERQRDRRVGGALREKTRSLLYSSGLERAWASEPKNPGLESWLHHLPDG